MYIYCVCIHVLHSFADTMMMCMVCAWYCTKININCHLESLAQRQLSSSKTCSQTRALLLHCSCHWHRHCTWRRCRSCRTHSALTVRSQVAKQYVAVMPYDLDLLSSDQRCTALLAAWHEQNKIKEIRIHFWRYHALGGLLG